MHTKWTIQSFRGSKLINIIRIFFNFIYYKFKSKLFHNFFLNATWPFFSSCIPLPVSLFFLRWVFFTLHSSNFNILTPGEMLVRCQRGSFASLRMSSMTSLETGASLETSSRLLLHTRVSRPSHLQCSLSTHGHPHVHMDITN